MPDLTPDEREQVLALFEELTDLAVAERNAALDRAKVPSAVRDEVESLLAQDARTAFGEGQLGQVGQQMLDDHRAAQRPTQVGPYRIVDILGEGGMGEVYLAEQHQPVKRRVALKIIKLGMSSREIVARFEQERQALALMNHEAIAKVYDAGITEQGQPYFVMEYVEGQPIAQFCAEHRLNVRQRVELLASACNGVQHAHQKGVIHRDLKPSNVLVSQRDGGAAVKIIDFGLARSIDEGAIVELSLQTRPGQMLGTLDYMSPEQARGDTQRIDTRTDVYALGVILYEILCGQRPFSFGSDAATSIDSARRQIEDDEPPKPSTRVTGSTTATSPPGAQESLSRTLRGDLDAIVMKAMAKEPERRYESCSTLRRDLERYLADEPVHAQPPSRNYRLRKLVRRHRLQFAAAGLVLLTVLVGAGVAAGFAVQASDQRDIAETRLERWTSLADRRRLEQLAAEAVHLWPAAPTNIEPIRGWLRRAEELAAGLPEHRGALRELRAVAIDDADAVAKADRRHYRAEHTRLAEIDILLRPVEQHGVPPGEYHDKLTSERDALLATVGTRHSWLFESDDLAFRHRQLAELVADLEAFATVEHAGPSKTIADVRVRLATAEQLREDARSPAFLSAWNELTADVARPESIYGGLKIQPIPGLVPLGVDRDSGLWELHHPASGDAPTWDGTPLGTGAVALSDAGREGMVLVLVPGGTFRMGAIPVEFGRLEDPNVDFLVVKWEYPVNPVTLDPFLIGKYEVTQAQWLRLYGENPSYYYIGRSTNGETVTPRHPVTDISWHDSADAARRWGLTLPTEARWEYACRANSGDAYFCGDLPDSLNGYANVADEGTGGVSSEQIQPTHGVFDGYRFHSPIGSYRPNAFGLYDTHGNVAEPILEELRNYAHFSAREGDGFRGLSTDPPTEKCIVRGGSFRENGAFARSATRVTLPVRAGSVHIGMRVARGLE